MLRKVSHLLFCYTHNIWLNIIVIFSVLIKIVNLAKKVPWYEKWKNDIKFNKILTFYIVVSKEIKDYTLDVYKI